MINIAMMIIITIIAISPILVSVLVPGYGTLGPGRFQSHGMI